MNARRRQLAIVSGLAVAALALATAVYFGREKLVLTPATEVSIQPQFVSPLGEGGDPRTVMVGFAWTENGYCSGQFHVTAIESRSEVRVGPVISRTYGGGACAGVGSDGKLAWAPMTLASPLDQRIVVRDSDGVALPVFAPDALLQCKDVIGSEAEPSADLSTVFDQVALPTVNALQANPSGAADPHASLFAKWGLFVASGSSFELSVPDAWLGRLTIGWGSPATRTTHFHVSGCEPTGSQKRWLVFSGGYWTNAPACVPIIVSSGGQEQTVQIGVGVSCPGQGPPPPGT